MPVETANTAAAAVAGAPVSVLNTYIPVLVLVIAAIGLAGLMVVLSWVLGPRRPTPQKLATYESGVTPIGSARERFPIKFYLVAMLFIIFDIETVFLYPWAVTYKDANFLFGYNGAMVFNLFEMIVFVAILFVGYIYVWRRGAFEWD
jgi:NADH-quinone oxidoreductase subunit A